MNPGVRRIYKFGRIIHIRKKELTGMDALVSNYSTCVDPLVVASTNGLLGDTANRSAKHSSAHPAAPRAHAPAQPPVRGARPEAVSTAREQGWWGGRRPAPGRADLG